MTEDLVRRIAGLSPAKRALLAARNPLSFGQERLWFLEQLEGGSPAYYVGTALRLEGELDVTALRRSFTEIVRRHEALRTTFAAPDGEALQLVHPAAEVPVPILDLRGLPAALREEEARRALVAEARRPFDLEAGPLLRCRLARLDCGCWFFALSVHHIVFDGRSTDLLVRELVTLYDAFAAGRQSPLPELSLQYLDFARWQRQVLQGERLERLLSFWKSRLEGSPQLLQLPLDRPRPKVRSGHGGHRAWIFLPAAGDALRSLAQRGGTTLFTAALAVFLAFLGRISGQSDVVAGFPVAGRTRPELEPLIGFFVNTLVVRAKLSGGAALSEHLAAVREALIDAQSHQELPFDQLVKELHPERDLSHAPLFQVLFAFLPPIPQIRQVRSLAISRVELDMAAAQFDLALSMAERENGVWGRLDYSRDLFDSATAERMTRWFEGFLEEWTHGGRRLGEVPLLRAAERHQVIAEWNDCAATRSGGLCLHDLIEQQGVRTPDAIAVLWKGEATTYRELDHRAGLLAARLRALGAGPEVPVGICLQRSTQMVIAILATLKAGALYVPLDPAYPKERLALILEDCRAPLLIAEPLTRGAIPVGAADVVEVEEPGERDLPPWGDPSPGNLAYLIYTSGSTGRPKGVAIEHRSAVAFVSWALGAFSARELAGVLASTSICFDLSVFEIFVTLSAGGTVVLAENVLELPNLAAKERVTLVNSVPSALAELSQMGALPSSVKTVNLAGEPLPISLARQLLRQGVLRVLDLYGPSEATTYSTWSSVDPEEEVPAIGRPIENTLCYVLDGSGWPVPMGVSGELYLGGAGLARGYLARPDLTAERFVPDPLGKEPGARLYRTGDRVRHSPDGRLHFLGRSDQQVKLRGFRIEPGEVEAALETHPRVSQAVVALRHDGPGEGRLVAYVVPTGGAAPPAGELRSALQEKLPGHMVPSAFVFLSALPLNPSGKIDRGALPVPGEPSRRDNIVVPPRTPAEKVLADIWREVLRIDRVGAHDRFFDLGGDSILSMKVVTKARQAGIHITPKQLFQEQTVARLAAVACTVESSVARQEAVVGPVPLTPIQSWFLEQEVEEPHHWNQALLLEVREPLPAAVVESVAVRLHGHHDALRLRFARGEAGWQQFDAPPSEEAAVTQVDLSAVPAEAQAERISAAAAQAQAALDLAGGPLARFVSFDLGLGRSGRLLVVVHHLAMDGVSWRVLLEDLQALWRVRGRGRALPPRTSSFQSWALRLEAHARSAQLSRELEHWLAEASEPVAPLPLDFEHGPNTVAWARTIRVALSPAETTALLREIPSAYRTQMNDVLLTALTLAVGDWTGVPCLLLDLEGHGREDLFPDLDLSRTVGWFTSLCPVRLDLRGVVGPGEALVAVKEKLRGIPGRGISYGLLRHLSSDPRVRSALAGQPGAGLVFNYLGVLDREIPADSPLAPAHEPIVPFRSPRGARAHLLEVTGAVAEGQLSVSWTYSAGLHRPATIRRLAKRFLEELRRLIEHCLSPEAGAYTPSDFPDVALSVSDLDAIFAQIEKARSS